MPETLRRTESDSRVATALAHHLAGRRADAEHICRVVLEGRKNHPAALHLLAVMARSQGRLIPALRLARMAVAADPAIAGFHNTLGIILGDLRRWDECFTALQASIELDPASFEAHRNLGVALAKAARNDDAVGPLARSAELRPNDPETWRLFASLHHGRLDLPQAIEARRRALSLRPDDAPSHSDLLVTLHYNEGSSARQLFDEHLAWARRHEDPALARFPERPFDNSANPARPLRVGYLCGDFREHPIARFLPPVLANHDRALIGVYCYSDVPCPDRQTERFRALADVWRDVSAMDDDAVAEAVRADRIDVLVDLAGHLDNRRLLVFARRPAPVQATYIGYSDTTGMRSIGYRITDAFHAPPESSVGPRHTEQLVRLPGSCWAYDAGDDPAPPEVNELPAAGSGRVTFAVFNRLIKATPQMAALWSHILRRVPNSRLLVLDLPGTNEPSLRAALARLGLRGDIGVRPHAARAEYLARYHEADIALDTHPYAGVTTTCDATWMGVPTVTLAGNTHVSRSGVSLLSAVGLPELIAQTPEDYVEIAVRLASDLPRLAALRTGLRQRMRQSPLCDGQRLARSIEAAYRDMWRKWCGDGK
jgi:protein O-GlcNAc transferase